MTPTRLGHRAAAQSNEENPFDFKTHPQEHDAWVNSAARVKAFRRDGLDPAGHQPPIPHLCIRATRANPAVCNCCDTCKAECYLEGTVDAATTKAAKIIAWPVRKLLKKLFG